MKNVIDYLQKTVSIFPEKIAVKDSEKAITFKQLWLDACCISLSINKMGGAADSSLFA